MKRRQITLAFAVLATFLAASPLLAKADSPDEFQRYIVINNTSDRTIYPVIQAPQNTGPDGSKVNCGSVPGADGKKVDGLLRIIVNLDAKGSGVPQDQSVKVALPKSAPDCPDGAFYNAARIFMLYGGDKGGFEALDKLLNTNQQTREYPGWNPDICPGCWVGIASADPAKPGADYGYDIPGQLLEYTIISQTPDGKAFPSANDPRGRSLIDFDVSYVDYAHLPYAMALGDGGATQFMGSTFGNDQLPLSDFPDRLSAFLADANWSGFAAYRPLHWESSDDCAKGRAPDGGPADLKKTRFSCLIDVRTDVVPSAAILIADARDGGYSGFFKPEADGTVSEQCVAPDGQNAQCAVELPNNQLCCPDPINGMLGCCDMKNFQVDRILSKWVANPDKPNDPNAGTLSFLNPTLGDLVRRFNQWHNNPAICDPGGAAVPAAPVIDQLGFCQAYQRTVDFVWPLFAGSCVTGDQDTQDRCTVAKIIGYDRKSGYDPDKCVDCTAHPDPDHCPTTCVTEQIANESVQSLQRGLPWTPGGPSDRCSKCPSTDAAQCPIDCVFPKEIAPDAMVYRGDKFLHFWANYDSIYNINPYAYFVHSPDGLAAPGAYSFSIDDFYGNFGGLGSTLIIQAGGYSTLPNQEPYDPFKQYSAGFGPGWDRVSVCGRVYRLPGGASSPVGLTAPVSFWDTRSKLSDCKIFAYPNADDDATYITFILKEVAPYQVTDRYTGMQQMVQGLSGVNAPRGGVTPLDPYCMEHSTASIEMRNTACYANLTAGSLNKDYSGVSDAACKDGNDATCGKPLVSLNVPPPRPTVAVTAP
ncbi:hypothetical protein [uncultured Thiodictyon sp.]|uniref:hypothetical protein n=1 Tax=uncultured Thiodictyon sp. TaxID=1846217 RepID=UPI0025F0BA20|nr:hypothetical protein [uncultured Thiodictyon sp.]